MRGVRRERRRGRKEGKGAEGGRRKEGGGSGDQDKMENSSSIALGNLAMGTCSMEKEVERNPERQR